MLMDVITFAIAVLALGLAGWSLFREKSARDRIQTLEERINSLHLNREPVRDVSPHMSQDSLGYRRAFEPRSWTEENSALDSKAAVDERPMVQPAADARVSEEAALTPDRLNIEVAAPPVETPGAFPGVASPPFSSETVAEYYAEWCRSPRMPPRPEGLEIAPMQYSRTESAGAVGRPAVLFKDAEQVAEFVRFSVPGDRHALVLPHPDAAFTSAVKYLFPDLDEEAYADGERDLFTTLEAVRVERRDDGLWYPIAYSETQP